LGTKSWSMGGRGLILLHIMIACMTRNWVMGNRPPNAAGLTTGPSFTTGPSMLPNPSAEKADGEWDTHATLTGAPYQFGLMSRATSSESNLTARTFPSSNVQVPAQTYVTADMMNSQNPSNLACVRDGVVGPQEQCDPGTAIDNSGCSSQCTVEWGWSCDGGVGERSVCDKVSKNVCYTAIFPKCGPQLGGDSGTILTVIGENFRYSAQYRARFALRSTAAMRDYRAGRKDLFWSPIDNSTQSEGDSTKFSAGSWISSTEVLAIFLNTQTCNIV